MPKRWTYLHNNYFDDQHPLLEEGPSRLDYCYSQIRNWEHIFPYRTYRPCDRNRYFHHYRHWRKLRLLHLYCIIQKKVTHRYLDLIAHNTHFRLHIYRKHTLLPLLPFSLHIVLIQKYNSFRHNNKHRLHHHHHSTTQKLPK